MLINLFLFGDVNNTPSPWINSMYYFPKDLNHVQFECQRLFCGIEDQTLFINHEPNKAFQSSKYSDLFIESSRSHKLSKNKVQWLDLASCLWPTLVRLPLLRIINVHYEFMIKYSKPRLTFFHQIILGSYNIWKVIMGASIHKGANEILLYKRTKYFLIIFHFFIWKNFWMNSFATCYKKIHIVALISHMFVLIIVE